MAGSICGKVFDSEAAEESVASPPVRYEDGLANESEAVLHFLDGPAP